jgi:hypothetical protein
LVHALISAVCSDLSATSATPRHVRISEDCVTRKWALLELERRGLGRPVLPTWLCAGLEEGTGGG